MGRSTSATPGASRTSGARAPRARAHLGRVAQLLREFTGRTHVIVITHNNGTMQAADVLYGVTMQQQGVSKLVSVRLVDDDGSDDHSSDGTSAHGTSAHGVSANG